MDRIFLSFDRNVILLFLTEMELNIENVFDLMLLLADCPAMSFVLVINKLNK